VTSSLGNLLNGHYTARVKTGDRYIFPLGAAEVTATSGPSDAELNLCVAFFDRGGVMTRQHCKSFTTTETYQALDLTGKVGGSEWYAVAFIENLHHASEPDLDDFTRMAVSPALPGSQLR
jgi:hypothetical protein